MPATSRNLCVCENPRASRQRVALSSLQRSLGEDASAGSKETPCKTLRLAQSMEEMDSRRARGFSSHSGDAGGGGSIYQSSGDAADVDREGRRDVFERA